MTVEEEDKVKADQAKAVEDAVAEMGLLHKRELAGVNGKVTELTKTLDKKTLEGQSIEERLASLEADKTAAVKRADSVEAFAKAGLSDDWRGVLAMNDPVAQAEALNGLIAGVKTKASEELSKEFNVDPEKHLDGSKRQFTAEDLKGKSPAEINRLWDEGRVVGAPSSA